MTFEKLLADVESHYVDGYTPGTVFTKVLSPEGGTRWCLGVGYMDRPKLFFYADTPREAVKNASKELRSRSRAAVSARKAIGLK